MISFAHAVLTGPLWFYVVLAGCIVTVWLAYDIRAVFCRSAWVVFALFFVWVAASNSWRFIPYPDLPVNEDLAARTEAWRLWTIYLYETLILAYLAAAAVTLGIMAWLVWGAYTGAVRFTMLTGTNAFVVFVAQAGEVMQRYVCKTNDPALGVEFRSWAAGERAEACGRLFADVLAIPAGETLGPLFFPILTALPLPFILWRTRRRIQDRLRKLAKWNGA